jgi:hypothetical protein
LCRKKSEEDDDDDVGDYNDDGDDDNNSNNNNTSCLALFFRRSTNHNQLMHEIYSITQWMMRLQVRGSQPSLNCLDLSGLPINHHTNTNTRTFIVNSGEN